MKDSKTATMIEDNGAIFLDNIWLVNVKLIITFVGAFSKLNRKT